ncbi:MAK10-like protein [Tanacetum coccineum]|uniref:MAK10-like protein n=1 Tax=Tanacetum coccineum TaxID=301880 RepID=A0ABQ4WWE9_9ASTR
MNGRDEMVKNKMDRGEESDVCWIDEVVRSRVRMIKAHVGNEGNNKYNKYKEGSITTWKDLTTRILAQFFPPGRTAKLRNDILMFQQHHEESLSEAWTRFKDLLQKVPHHGIDLWLHWNDPRDFAKPVKAIALPQDVPSTSDRRLIELKNQVQCLIKAHLALTQPTQVNKITTSCEICNGPYETQYSMEDPEQAFVEYASLRTDEAGGLVSNFMASQDARLSKFEADFKQQQSDMTNKINTVLKAITDGIVGALLGDIVKNPKLSTYPVLLVPQSSDTEVVCTKGDDGEVMFIELIRKNNDSSEGEPEEEGSKATEGVGAEYFDIFPTRSELAYHKYLMCSLIPSIFLRNPIIMEGCPSNLKIPCNIGHVHVEKSYIDPNSPLNIMTRMMYNWIMRRKLDPRENSNRGVSNFTGRIKGMHVFVGNFTYIVDFRIVEDISSIIDPRLSQVVLGKPFVEIYNMTHDPPEGVVRFTNGTDEVAYKMPQMIEQYNSLSDLEKEHTKSVYLRNKEDKRRGVEYVMIKILGFYKECLELGPEYVIRMDDKREVTKERVTSSLATRLVIFDKKKFGSSSGKFH